MHVTMLRKLTYFDRRVEVFEIRDAGQYGERWVYTHYIDQADDRNGGWPAGSYTAIRVKGDGRKDTFRVLVNRHEITEQQFREARSGVPHHHHH